MALMSAELYDALKEAGASEEKARKAAEAVAAFDQRFNKIENDLSVLKWMVGSNIALTITLMWKVFGS